MDYTSKVITIVNHTFTLANTWELVIAENKAIRKWYMRSREDNTRETDFDYAFVAVPTTYATNGGQGVAFDGVALPNVYCRVTDKNIVIELIYFS